MSLFPKKVEYPFKLTMRLGNPDLISSAEVPPVQAWSDWKPEPVYTIVLLFDLFCFFFASLSVNKLKMLPLCCVAFVSFALPATLLLLSSAHPPFPDHKLMSRWNFVLVEILLEMILV